MFKKKTPLLLNMTHATSSTIDLDDCKIPQATLEKIVKEEFNKTLAIATEGVRARLIELGAKIKYVEMNY